VSFADVEQTRLNGREGADTVGAWTGKGILKLLLIDGRADDRQQLKAALEAAHAPVHVIETSSTQEGVSAARESAPDCVIVDAGLPHRGSLGVITAVREVDPRIPVLALATDEREPIVRTMLEAGAVDCFFRSSLTAETVSRVLRHAMATASAERERQELIARERRAREQAEAASRAKDEFLAALSHELRTPLNAILGWARLLASGSLSGPSIQRAVDTIERNAQLQVRLIDELLDVSRIITGRLAIERVPLCLSALVEGEVDAVREAASARQIELRFTRTGHELPVMGDPDRLHQVVMHLLSNALKFTRSGGRVDVTVAGLPDRVRLSVGDTGEGIDAALLPRVFDRFSQRERSSSSRHTGLGLGLSIVKHLIEAHGGTVHASSPGLGEGATFVVELHATNQRPDVEETVAPAALGTLAGFDILLVDDDADGRELLATVLRRHGARVATAGSAAAALAHFARRKPDLILSDIGMPGQDGYSLLAQMKRAAPDFDIPAIAITAFTSADDRARAIAAGFQQHLAKPIDPDMLVATVARHRPRLQSRAAG
jgi:signal transduction histidine kinase